MTRMVAALAAFASVFGIAFFAAWDVALGAWEPASRFFVAAFAIYFAGLTYFLPHWERR